MKALTLHNPHATLVALGEKRWETRSFRPRKVRERYAITSTAAEPRLARFYHSIDEFRWRIRGRMMPNGHVLCTVEVTEILTTAAWFKIHMHKRKVTPIIEREYLFGDYGQSRYAWRLENIIVMDPPVPCKGKQGIWHLTGAVLEEVQFRESEASERMQRLITTSNG